MASTFQPPIHLDPTQDAAQQTAFINQNFQTLASALETNSFRIVKVGTISVVQGSVTGSAGIYESLFGQTIVAHNLPFTPIVQAYLNFGGSYIQTPYTAVNNISSSSTAWTTYYISTDATNIYFQYQGAIFGGGTIAGATFTANYYLLQQPAN